MPTNEMLRLESAGFRGVGSVVAGQLQECENLEQTFEGLPGKCYAVVALSAGILKLGIALTTARSDEASFTTFAASTGTGPNASIGLDGCVKYPFSVGGPFKVVLTATKGSGVAAARVYAK